MKTVAVVLEAPEQLKLRTLDLTEPQSGEATIDVEWTGISTGTEKLLWTGRMPHFPGMGYPLVPGYETVGRISKVIGQSKFKQGDQVFVPGAACFGDIKGLFGGAASKLVVPESRLVPLPDNLGEQGILIALAATAYHAIAQEGARPPELIVGHGILGRLIGRIALALRMPIPVCWEINVERQGGSVGYPVINPQDDTRRNYNSIYDASGDASILNTLIEHLAKGGEITLAGFYNAPLSFAFPPAFMREARLRVAAEWKKSDLDAVSELISLGKLSLSGLITHHEGAARAPDAYRSAFFDSHCLKMVLDWRTCA